MEDKESIMGGRESTVVPEELTVDGFAPYGQAILPPRTPAPKFGDTWDCWFELGRLSRSEAAVGIVVARRATGLVCAMEREPTTEFLVPITAPIVQTVALLSDLTDHHAQPDAATVRAFTLLPGQAIVMAPGTWHCAAMPLRDTALYYFITEPHPPEPGREASPWVPFLDNATVRVILSQ